MYESLFVVLDVIVEILIVPFYYICMYVILKDVFTDGNRQIQKETPTWNVCMSRDETQKDYLHKNMVVLYLVYILANPTLYNT